MAGKAGLALYPVAGRSFEEADEYVRKLLQLAALEMGSRAVGALA